MSPTEAIHRLTAAVPDIVDAFWRAAHEMEDAQTAAWLPFTDDDT